MAYYSLDEDSAVAAGTGDVFETVHTTIADASEEPGASGQAEEEAEIAALTGTAAWRRGRPTGPPPRPAADRGPPRPGGPAGRGPRARWPRACAQCCRCPNRPAMENRQLNTLSNSLLMVTELPLRMKGTNQHNQQIQLQFAFPKTTFIQS